MVAVPQPETNRPQGELLPALPTGGTQAAAQSSWLGRVLAVVGALLSAVYLSNIGLGTFELLPDVLPAVGNIDEVLFTLLLVYCLRKLGIDVAPFLSSRLRPRSP
jgi:hypothetical protein